MKILGYIRVNIPSSLEYQINRLLEYEIQEIFIENKNSLEYFEFDRLLGNLSNYDTLIVYSLESFWNNKSIYKIITILKEKNVRLIIVNKKIDTKFLKEFYNQLLFFLEVMKDSNLIVVSQLPNISKKKHGRPKISNKKVNEIQVLRSQQFSLREISAKCGLSLGTVHKYSEGKNL